MNERFMTFLRLINSISRSIYRIKAEVMAEFNLKSSHVNCIYSIYRGKAVTAAELCRACKEDKANVSRSLKELTELKLVTRSALPKGSRKVRYELTEEGREVAAFLSEQLDNILEIVDDKVTDDDRSVMYSVLYKIDDSLSKISREA